MAKWSSMTTPHAHMTSCKPGLLVNSPKTTSHYSFPLTVHSYFMTKPPTAGSSSGSSIIFVLDYATQNILLSQAALSLVPINPEKLTLTYIHHSIISLLYNTRASQFSMHLLRRYGEPFLSSQSHQLIALVQLPCLGLSGTVANKGAESTVQLLGSVERGMDIISQ